MVALGDANGDGNPDIFTMNSNGSVGVLLGNGDSTFRTAVTYADAGGGTSLSLGDVNGDGKLDVVTVNRVAGTVGVLLGHGDGTFGTAAVTTPGSGPFTGTLVDFNGDGKLDFVTVNSANTVSVMIGNGDGTFGAPVTSSAGAAFPRVLAVADFNGDGKMDVAVANGNGSSMSVLIGNGDGSFAAPVQYTVLDHTTAERSVTVGDVNGDGKLDIIVGSSNINGVTNNIYVFKGNGDGTFGTTPLSYFNGGGNPGSLALGNLSNASQFTGTVTEDATTPNLTAKGTIGFTDVELGDAHTASVVAAGGNTLGGTLTLGTVSESATTVPGNVGWNYSVANSVTQYLGAGQTATEVFTVTIDDGHGGTVSRDVTITVNGVNDAPVGVDDTGSATEAGGVNNGTAGSNATGNVLTNDTDVDNTTASLVVSAIRTGTEAGSGTSGTLGVALTGAHGTLTLAANGSYTYVVNNADAAVQALNVGNTITDTFTYTVKDTGALTDKAQLVVTINGADDAPVISALNNGSYATFNGAIGATASPASVQTDNVTIQGWFNWNGTGAVGTYQFMAYNGNTGSQGYGFMGYVVSSGQLQLQGLVGGNNFLISTTNITAGAWHEIALVRSSGVFSLYLDGTAISITNSTTGVNAIGAGSSTAVGSNQANGQQFNGSIADVSLWDVALTPAQISAGRYATLAGTETGLVGAWRFADGSGATAIDSAGTPQNLTFSATPTWVTNSISGPPGAPSYPTGVSQLLIAPAQIVSDVDSTNVASMTATLTARPDGNTFETLSLNAAATTAAAGLTVSYASTTGVLSIAGSATAATYQSILEGIQYTDTKTGVHSTADRVVNIVVNDGTLNSGTYSVTIHVAAPAGIAGEAINLGLTDLSAGGQTTITVSGMHAGWTLNAGTDNGNGTWTVQTNDPAALTVTTAADFHGASVLRMSETYTNADGSTGHQIILNNVEAYAPGSPIFAVSSDDHLSGSGNSDLFVFAQPIASDTIHNFNAAADKIDLIGFTGVSSFADIAIANDGNGNAVVTLAAGSTITVDGVDAGALTAANFEINVEPVMSNAGSITIGDGAILPLGGIIDNSGTIALNSAGNHADLEVLFQGVTFSGGGHLILSDNANNAIYGGSADTVFTNADNTISGAGQLGAGQLVLVNAGTIVADGTQALVIDTGASAVSNSGTLEATGSGGLEIKGDVVNDGVLWANGGDLTVDGAITGSGAAHIDGSAIFRIGGASSEDVVFGNDAAGTLQLGQSQNFGGTLTGFDSNDVLQLSDVLYGGADSLDYLANAQGTGGTLTVSDGTHTAQIQLQGQYEAAGFALSSLPDLTSALLGYTQPAH